MLERNHQVGIMGSVYSSSACALIWLGPQDEGSDRALSLIDSLDNTVLEYRACGDENDIQDFVDDTNLPADVQAWRDTEALFLRPWFKRLWTFQEPIRAPDRIIACGSNIRSWETFANAAFVLMRWNDVAANSFFTIHGVINEESGALRLSDLIYSNWQREATDPRDYVYALYGLVQGYQKVPLEISYAMSVEDVYRSTVRFCIENEGKLSILGQVAIFKNQPDLPSWVPDWRNRTPSGSDHVTDNLPYPSLIEFKASSAAPPLLLPSSSNDKLILKGFTLSIVERTIGIDALRLNPADSSPDSWRTNTEAAGVPVHFLQGKTLHTTYDLTTMIETSPFHSNLSEAVARTFWPNSTRWIAAGCPDPIPEEVLTEYKETFDTQTRSRCLFLTKDSLGLAPEPTQVGDRVCILLGGDAPFILRPCQNTASNTPSKEAKPKRQSALKTTPKGRTKARSQGSRKSARVAKQVFETTTEWTLIGDCYLYGYMRGEAMETVTEADYMNFTLV